MGLLGGDDLVEVNFEFGAGEGEEIVVYVGKNGKAEAGFELAKCGGGVGPGLPDGE